MCTGGHTPLCCFSHAEKATLQHASGRCAGENECGCSVEANEAAGKPPSAGDAGTRVSLPATTQPLALPSFHAEGGNGGLRSQKPGSPSPYHQLSCVPQGTVPCPETDFFREAEEKQAPGQARGALQLCSAV